MANIHVKTALNNIRRTPFQALSALFVLMITFFVTTILLIFVYSSNQVIRYFETRPQIIAFLTDTATELESQDLINKLKSDSKIRNVTYVSKEQALEIYKNATSENPLLTELVSPSIFPASVEFTLNDLSYAEGMITELKNESIVDEVGFTASLGGEESLTDVVARLRQISYYIRLGGGIFAGFLLGTSFILILVIMGMRMTTRRNEVEILSLIGATPGFIRSPIMLEALLYAFTGVFAGWLISLLIILYSTPSLLKYFGEIPILPGDTITLLSIFGIILGIELFIGTLLCLVGSFIAVSRAGKKK
ncbi:MAG TPA: permease-like cell division protein FtsX [Patescibacteria group bacterium]|nr:permease-like cell division protein FtsX [Patescibacteria group bacterium]